RRYGTSDLHFARGAIDSDLGTSCDVASFLRSARDAETVVGLRLAFAPAELFGGRFQHRAETRVFEILESKFQRIHRDGVGEIIDVTLAREVVGGCRERTVRPLLQRRTGCMGRRSNVRNVVKRPYGGTTGIVIVELPGGDGPVFSDAGAHFDDA